MQEFFDWRKNRNDGSRSAVQGCLPCGAKGALLLSAAFFVHLSLVKRFSIVEKKTRINIYIYIYEHFMLAGLTEYCTCFPFFFFF